MDERIEAAKDVQQNDDIGENYYNLKPHDLEEIEPDIPADPPHELIKRLLGELPSQIEYLENKGIEIKKKMLDGKIYIRAKKAATEIEKSKIRKEITVKYQNDLKEYIKEYKEMMEDPKYGKMTKADKNDLLKSLKPEKPTKNDLDDEALIRTEGSQREIFKLEQTLNKWEEQYELILSKVKKYENKNLAVRTHARIIESDLKRN